MRQLEQVVEAAVDEYFPDKQFEQLGVSPLGDALPAGQGTIAVGSGVGRADGFAVGALVGGQVPELKDPCVAVHPTKLLAPPLINKDPSATDEPL